MEDKKLPIGYYLKQVDKLLTERIDAVQKEFGLTRTSWQVLNSINEQGTAKRDELINLMVPLADKNIIGKILLTFSHDGIITIESGNLISLTEKGKALFADCSKKQNEFRKQSVENVSDQEYQTTVLTLEKILKNLQ